MRVFIMRPCTASIDLQRIWSHRRRIVPSQIASAQTHGIIFQRFSMEEFKPRSHKHTRAHGRPHTYIQYIIFFMQTALGTVNRSYCNSSQFYLLTDRVPFSASVALVRLYLFSSSSFVFISQAAASEETHFCVWDILSCVVVQTNVLFVHFNKHLLNSREIREDFYCSV